MQRTFDGGFTLVELMVVVLIIATLMAIAVPTFFGAKLIAEDAAAQTRLVAALKTEEVYATDGGSYTSDAAVLRGLESSLDWSGTDDDAIHVSLASVVLTNDVVLLFTRSNSGTWFGLRHVRQGATAGRYECSGATRQEVDDMTDCTGHDW